MNLSDVIYTVRVVFDSTCIWGYYLKFSKSLRCLRHCGIWWSDFEEKKCYTLYGVPNCCWTPIPKFHALMLPLSVLQGL